MQLLPNESIDMILTDPPQGITHNDWDKPVPFEPMWEQFERVIKPNGAIVIFANEPYTARLICSNEKLFKYSLVWDKVLTSGFLNANRMPLRQHEDICVFYKKQPTYNPQKTPGKPNHSKGKPKETDNNNYGKYNFMDNREELGGMKHPTSILTFSKSHPSKSGFATEKPISLLSNLILTYTNPGDTVLDCFMAKGGCGVAALQNGRRFVGIEKNAEYYQDAAERKT